MTSSVRQITTVTLCTLLLLLCGKVTTTFADSDHDTALILRQHGEILPLQQILAAIPERYGERILEVELEQKHGNYFYEIELLDDRGTVHEIYIDAVTGLLQQDNPPP